MQTLKGLTALEVDHLEALYMDARRVDFPEWREARRELLAALDRPLTRLSAFLERIERSVSLVWR